MTVDVDIDPDEDLFGYNVSDLQSDIVIGDGAITGNLAFIDDYSSAFGPGLDSGNYIAIHASVPDVDDVTITVTITNPSVLDEDGIFVGRIADKDSQTITVVASKDGYESVTKVYDLGGLTCQADPMIEIGPPGKYATIVDNLKPADFQTNVVITPGTATLSPSEPPVPGTITGTSKYQTIDGQAGNYLTILVATTKSIGDATISVECDNVEWTQKEDTGIWYGKLDDEERAPIIVVASDGATFLAAETYTYNDLILEPAPETPGE